MIVSPVRYDRLQAALVAALVSATGKTVTWSYGPGVFDGPLGAADLIDLTIAVGPIALDLGRRRHNILPPTVVDLAIDSVVVGQRYMADINDHAFYYDAVLTDDAADIRDGLIAAMADEALFAAAASGALVRLTPASFGGIWQLGLFGPLSVDDLVLSSSVAQVSEGTHRITISVGCFSTGTSPRAGAWNLASVARAAFDAGDLVDALDEAEISIVSVGAGIDLSDITGAAWRSRVSFDLVIDLPARFVRPVDRVTSIVYAGEPSFTVSI